MENSLKWEKPLPLSDAGNLLPVFPIEAYPEKVKNYVLALSENTQTSVDMAAVIALGILSVGASRSCRIEGNANYYEPLNLYILLVAEPGERKSSIMQSLSQFLFNYEQKENERLRLMGNEKSLRLYADDCSSEALTTLLAENDGIMAVISAEGSIFDILAGRYNPKLNLDIWLKGHSGDEIRIDRKNRGTEYIKNPRLTTVLAVQPTVLEEIMSNKAMTGR